MAESPVTESKQSKNEKAALSLHFRMATVFFKSNMMRLLIPQSKVSSGEGFRQRDAEGVNLKAL